MSESDQPGGSTSQIPTQMTTTAGQLDNFDRNKEHWECYFERFEQFTVINHIASERQVACLLAVMGPSTYGVLRNLVYPEKPKDKSLDEISTVLEERFRFYTAVQESETIAQFVSRLKKLAKETS